MGLSLVLTQTTSDLVKPITRETATAQRPYAITDGGPAGTSAKGCYVWTYLMWVWKSLLTLGCLFFVVLHPYGCASVTKDNAPEDDTGTGALIAVHGIIVPGDGKFEVQGEALS